MWALPLPVDHDACCAPWIDRRSGILRLNRYAILPPGSLRLAARIDHKMSRPSLDGRSILIVEDEPLIVMDITMALEITGAALTTTNTLKHALLLVEHDGLACAVLDHSLGDGNSSALCARLTERGIPFMIYSGVQHIVGPCSKGPHLMKPATHADITEAVERMILPPRRIRLS